MKFGDPTAYCNTRPICNHHRRLVVRKQSKRFATILRKQQGIPLLREGLLYRFAIDRRIIDG
jgi:hypothetical protein